MILNLERKRLLYFSNLQQDSLLFVVYKSYLSQAKVTFYRQVLYRCTSYYRCSQRVNIASKGRRMVFWHAHKRAFSKIGNFRPFLEKISCNFTDRVYSLSYIVIGIVQLRYSKYAMTHARDGLHFALFEARNVVINVPTTLVVYLFFVNKWSLLDLLLNWNAFLLNY